MIKKYKRILSGLLVVIFIMMQGNITYAETIYKDGQAVWTSTGKNFEVGINEVTEFF